MMTIRASPVNPDHDTHACYQVVYPDVAGVPGNPNPLTELEGENGRYWISHVLETCRINSAAELLVDKLPWLKFEISSPSVKLENITEAPPPGLNLDWMTRGHFYCPLTQPGETGRNHLTSLQTGVIMSALSG
jgi:hypothetical protein